MIVTTPMRVQPNYKSDYRSYEEIVASIRDWCIVNNFRINEISVNNNSETIYVRCPAGSEVLTAFHLSFEPIIGGRVKVTAGTEVKNQYPWQAWANV